MPADSPANGSAEKMKKLYSMIEARYGVICVTTGEEGRFLKILDKAVATQATGPAYVRVKTWSASEGMNEFQNGRKEYSRKAETTDLKTALELVTVADKSEGTVFVFRDVHLQLGSHGDRVADSAEIISRLRDCARFLRGRNNTLILLGASFVLPPELEKEVAVFDFPLPDEREMKVTAQNGYRAWVENHGEQGCDPYNDELIGEVARSCMGMTELEAEDAITLGTNELDGFGKRMIPAIHASKQMAIKRVGCLEAIPVTYGMESVGGLDRLKQWVYKRKDVFSDKAREFGVEPPKGLMTLGVPGGGKGIAARAVASAWNVPLIRLDMGAVMGMWLGESEGNLRRAFKVAEALAPCVLWVDEVEKSLGGGGSGGKHETSSRVFGNLLTWMQEKESSVILYFTANDIKALPPELLRKGRLDEMFFIDLPDAADRAEILSIHLKKRKRNPKSFDLAALAQSCRGFVGAEIEQGIVEAIVDAFSEGARDITDNHIKAAFARTTPLIKVQPEQMRLLREFVQQGRAISASSRLPDDEGLVDMARPATRPSKERGRAI